MTCVTKTMKTRFQALFKAVGNNSTDRLRPCDVQKTNKLAKIEARGIDGIPNECLSHLPRRPLVQIHSFIQPLVSSPTFSAALEGGKKLTILNPGKNPKFTSNKPHVHNGLIIQGRYSKNSPKAHRTKGLCTHKSIWPSCTSEYDNSIYEAYESRDLKFH